jgi:hypothetical protein
MLYKKYCCNFIELETRFPLTRVYIKETESGRETKLCKWITKSMNEQETEIQVKRKKLVLPALLGRDNAIIDQ